jgi:hypothetical protein
VRALGLFSKKKRDSDELDTPLPPAPAPPGFSPSPNVAQDIKREIDSVPPSDLSSDFPDLPDIPDITAPETSQFDAPKQVMPEPKELPNLPPLIPAPQATAPKPVPKEKPVPKREYSIPKPLPPEPVIAAHEDELSLPDFTPEDLAGLEDEQSQEPMKIESALYVETNSYRNVMRTSRDLKTDVKVAMEHADKISLMHEREVHALSAWRSGLERIQDALMKTDSRLFER